MQSGLSSLVRLHSLTHSLLVVFAAALCYVAAQLMNALDLLAKCHQANEDYKSAAYTLSSFKFDDFKSDGRLEQ